MWYFAWILGTCLAAAFAVLNALWFELNPHFEEEQNHNREVKRKRKRKQKVVAQVGEKQSSPRLTNEGE